MSKFEPTGRKPNQRLHVSMSFMGWGGVGWAKFICTTSHTWWYATVSLLALPHIHDATLLYVFLHCLTYMMLRYCKSSIWTPRTDKTWLLAGPGTLFFSVQWCGNTWVTRRVASASPRRGYAQVSVGTSEMGDLWLPVGVCFFKNGSSWECSFHMI